MIIDDGHFPCYTFGNLTSLTEQEDIDMNTVTLRAHFDGEKICLDEPFELKPDAKLIITVLLEEQPDDEHGIWLLFSQQGLETAYGADEAEYSLDLIKESNPDYEGR